jgi:hypothetical protein
MPSVSSIFKSLFQLGPQPLALNTLYKLGLWTGHYKRIERRRSENRGPVSNIQSLFSLPKREELTRAMGKDGRTALLKEADEIVAGKFRMFGGEPVPIQLTFNEPLHHWADYETHKAPIPDSQLPVHDIKFIWEPARFGWAFTLGRAYHVSGEGKYAEAFWKYFEGFTNGNPPYLGPHWMNGQEVAIRLMALVWAAQVLADSPHSTPERVHRLAGSIADHAARIPSTLVYARSQGNNHLLTEAAGLFTAGLALPGHPEAERWRALGWKWLNRALQRQISDYGEYIQHSTNYHRLMLQVALWVDMLLRQRGERWPRESAQALRRATHWLFSLLDPDSGGVPNLGANDGSYLFPLTVQPFGDYRPVLQAAGQAFLGYQLAPGPWNEMPFWLGLKASEKHFQPESYLNDNLHGRYSWAYLRASSFQSRLSHMDQLHLDLWWRSLNVAQDAGSYLYNAEPPWDNPLTASAVHNTITVDGCDQMTRAGRFLTLDWANAYSKSQIITDEHVLQQMTAHHNGYFRLGVRHQRTVTVYDNERWVVTDELCVRRPGKRKHFFRLHWLLLDGEPEMKDRESGVGIRLKSRHGWITLNIDCESRIPKPEYRISLVRAGELVYGRRDVLPFEGWISLTYGVKIPALSLAVEVESSQEVTFISEFCFPKP